MKKTDIFLAGIAGTTAFTLFSYLISKMADKEFEEPLLLGKMIERVTPESDKKYSLAPGWILHYAIGVFFYSLL